MTDIHPQIVFVVLQGFIIHSNKDLRIYGVYTKRSIAEKAVRSIGTRYKNPIFGELEGSNSPVPPIIVEVFLNAHPDRTSGLEGCHLRFKDRVGLDPFWLSEKEIHHDSINSDRH